MRYNANKDQRRKDQEEQKEKEANRLKKDAEDEKKAAALDKKNKEAKEKKKAEAKKASKEKARQANVPQTTVVGKGDKDTKTEAEARVAIQNNLDHQSSVEAGGASRVVATGRLSAFKPAAESVGWELVEQVDAASAANITSTTSKPYFISVLRSTLSLYDTIDKHDNLHCCLSFAHYSPSSPKTSKGTSSNQQMVVDTGATSHMRRQFEDFEPDSDVRCTNTFVSMGDALHVPVVGYGTSRIKVDCHVICLQECLHVPALDCDLFSGTRHGSRGQGHLLLLTDKEMHLAFPSFVHRAPIPDSNNLKITLEKICDSDWLLPVQFCDDGNALADCELSAFANKLSYLNYIFKSRHAGRVMTQAQQKKHAGDLKKALGAQAMSETVSPDYASKNLISDLVPRGSKKSDFDSEKSGFDLVPRGSQDSFLQLMGPI